ncbi:hypothetical protein GOBAR_AA00141 [Gossypium barbadense]|uniref:Uncharacterized protein n=1 Tax=Gossypium barbadense TaxID=3634 RepID=A0A2P5YXT8_GOSBA|nr:hypothetical protein GOBAR_AA00141 [Gossypium barbadense]
MENGNSFQNIETTLKNQQASIQRLETQIGQLAKLISERLQGSLPSNTESNPREQLNAITIQDKEGLVEPEPEPGQGIVVSKSKGEVDHSEQTLVGDKVLLDAADPRIATSKSNGKIPLMVLNIFPYGTVEVIHPKFNTFKSLKHRVSNPHSPAHGRALGRAHTVDEDTTVRYDRVKTGKKFSQHEMR